MHPTLLASIIISSIIGACYVIYLIVYIIKECSRINRESTMNMREVAAISEELRRLIAQHDLGDQPVNFESEEFGLMLNDVNSEKGWMTEPFKNTTEEDCVVCMNTLTQDCIATRCFHKFHLECIKKWEFVSRKLKNDFVCPICKQKLYEKVNDANDVMEVIIQ